MAENSTIEQFGEQWQRYTANDGYYASGELFQDILGPLVQPEELREARVADVGSGTGRIVNMLLDCGCSSVVALEPSAAYSVLRENTAERASSITYMNASGTDLPARLDLDFVFSIGVLHHIPDPLPVVRAAFQALKPGGSLVVWLYGRENNGLYLGIASTLRRITTHLPDGMLSTIAAILDGILSPYIALCRLIPLPMRSYLLSHYAKLSRENRRLTIFDQLNPTHAMYYRREEVEQLLRDGGFADIKLFHRHGYSWTARGIRQR